MYVETETTQIFNNQYEVSKLVDSRKLRSHPELMKIWFFLIPQPGYSDLIEKVYYLTIDDYEKVAQKLKVIQQ